MVCTVFDPFKTVEVQSACVAHAPSFLHTGRGRWFDFRCVIFFFFLFINLPLISLQSTSFLNFSTIFDGHRLMRCRHACAAHGQSFIHNCRGRWFDSRSVNFFFPLYQSFFDFIAIHKVPKCLYCF